MNLGRFGTLPLRLGGSPTPSERAYNVIRKAVGIGGSADDDRGIDGLWRSSKAKGLAAASSHVRRAFLQSNPLFATDLIPYYERILGIVPPEGSSDAQRRAALIAPWTRKILADMPSVAAVLTAIDPRFVVLEPSRDQGITTQPGRAYGQTMVLPQACSKVANYSTEFILRIRFTPGYEGVLSNADRLLIDAANRLLRELVQSWETWTISTGPWKLGITPIGRGSLGA